MLLLCYCIAIIILLYYYYIIVLLYCIVIIILLYYYHYYYHDDVSKKVLNKNAGEIVPDSQGHRTDFEQSFPSQQESQKHLLFVEQI